MPRLFAAIKLDSRSRDRVITATSTLAAELRGSSLRWVRPEHLHLTLVFLGEVSEGTAAAVVSEMRRAIPEPAFDIELGGFGVFPSHGAPSVLWVGIRSGSEAVIAVHRVVEARLGALGFPPERRRFTPHLTVGRWAGRGTRPSERPRLDGNQETIASVRVDVVTLFQSRLSPGGPTHTPLAESRLAQSNQPVH